MATTITTTKLLTPHVIFLPYAMTSHIMPLVHLARLFAVHGGLKVTIITTPHNALLFQSSVDHDHTMLGSNISVQTIKFPSDKVGLPEGVENYSASLSFEIALKIRYAFSMLQKPIEQLIRHLNPQCIVSDALFPWTVDLAEQLHIPRFSFQPNNFFHQCVWHCLNESYIYRDQIDSDLFLIPGLPHEIKMKNSEIEEFIKKETYVWKILKSVMGADLRSHGIIHNTCSELEPGYAQYYEEIRGGTKVWHVGPIALFINTLESSEGTISNSIILDTTSSISYNNPDDPWKDYGDCLSWLEDQEPNSVLFVCFGSSVRFSNEQIREITSALKAANCPFILVVKDNHQKDEGNDQHDYGDHRSFDGFYKEEMLVKKNKCLIIKGWAPQVLILKHRAIGGFMTHCGWNSILEALALGVPLITWPLFAEQFYNQKLLEQVLGVAIGVGADVWNSGFNISSPVVSREKIELAIKRLMISPYSDESRKIRANAKLIAEKLKTATEEGGSCHSHLFALIEEIKRCANFNVST